MHDSSLTNYFLFEVHLRTIFFLSALQHLRSSLAFLDSRILPLAARLTQSWAVLHVSFAAVSIVLSLRPPLVDILCYNSLFLCVVLPPTRVA